MNHPVAVGRLNIHERRAKAKTIQTIVEPLPIHPPTNWSNKPHCERTEESHAEHFHPAHRLAQFFITHNFLQDSLAGDKKVDCGRKNPIERRVMTEGKYPKEWLPVPRAEKNWLQSPASCKIIRKPIRLMEQKNKRQNQKQGCPLIDLIHTFLSKIKSSQNRQECFDCIVIECTKGLSK